MTQAPLIQPCIFAAAGEGTADDKLELHAASGKREVMIRVHSGDASIGNRVQGEHWMDEAKARELFNWLGIWLVKS